MFCRLAIIAWDRDCAQELGVEGVDEVVGLEVRVERQAGEAPVLSQPVGDDDLGERLRLQSAVGVDDADRAFELLGEEDAAVRREGDRADVIGQAVGDHSLRAKAEGELLAAAAAVVVTAGERCQAADEQDDNAEKIPTLHQADVSRAPVYDISCCSTYPGRIRA